MTSGPIHPHRDLHVASEFDPRRSLSAAHIHVDHGRRHLARAEPGVDEHRSVPVGHERHPVRSVAKERHVIGAGIEHEARQERFHRVSTDITVTAGRPALHVSAVRCPPVEGGSVPGAPITICFES